MLYETLLQGPASSTKSKNLLLSFYELVVIAAVSFFLQATAIGPVSAQVSFQAAPITIEEADRILRSRLSTTFAQNGFVGPSLPAPTAQATSVELSASAPMAAGCASGAFPIEIITLANSLKCDVDLIFEYVYDNIEYEPIFGSNKGALGTLLDQRGSDIDQAQLFVALLHASGITQTKFIYGYITVTGTTAPTRQQCIGATIAPASGWLGVKNDGLAIGTVFTQGGIPLEQGAVFDNNDGTLDCADVAHVWVQVTIAGTNYVFDPSFKQHTVSIGFTNLGSVLGYTRSQFLADAGGTVDSVSIAGIDRAKVRSDLTGYANNLVAYIKANDPAYSLSQVIGGKAIIPLTGSPIRQTSLPYLSQNQPTGFPQNWGTTIPNMYRACLAISMPGVTNLQPCASAVAQTVVLYADETYGQRITVFSVPDPAHAGQFIPTLRVNGAAPSNGTATGPSTANGQPWSIYTSITHPFANIPTASQSGTLNASAGGAYLIGAGWGGVGRGMVQKHRQLLAQALSVTGVDPSSESVLGESLAVISYNWLAENTAQQLLADAINQTTTQLAHGVGITAQRAIQNSGSQGPYIDIPFYWLGMGSQTCWPSTTCVYPMAPFMELAGASSSFESAVLLQTQAPTPNMTAASTVALVDQNAGTGAKTFFADGTTSAGQSNYINLIRPLLQPGTPPSYPNYSMADIAIIDVAITGASPPPASPVPTTNQALAPLNGSQSVGLWKGTGYSIISQTSSLIGVAQLISGGASGGASGTDVSADDQSQNTDGTVQTNPGSSGVPTPFNPAPASNDRTVNEPIDAVTGAEIYKNMDMVIGGGAFPYALSFGRTYLSSSNLVDVGLGNGWTHNYSYSAAVNSDPYEGMGASSPIRSAAAIAALYVAHDLLVGSTQSAQSVTLAWMTARWMADQLTNNVVLVKHPDTVEEFVALPRADGQTTTSYNPPLGSAVVLTGSGAGNPTNFTYLNKDQTKLTFAPVSGSSSAPISAWTSPNGMQVSFAYNGSANLKTVTNNLGRHLDLSYTGNHITSVSDGTRSTFYSYAGSNLTAARDPLSNRTTYAYDAASHLTQVYYPNAPDTAYFTNLYDGLGRVAQQLNANGQAASFYFAGPRTEIIDALGGRHVTYQAPRNKIVKDAAILSPSFGNVFYDTQQQNGIVNISSTQYDGLDRVVLKTAPEGGTIGYSYSLDFKNNVVASVQTVKPGSSLAPLTTNYSYHPVFNKVTSIIDPRGLITTMQYDAIAGNLLRMTSDAGGSGHFNATYNYSYGSIGLPVTSSDPLGVQTQISYDGAGNPISIIRDCCGIGHLNQTTALVYDSFGDVILSTDPNGNRTTNTYDPDRQLLTTTSPKTPAAPNGLVTSLTYSPVGQLIHTTQLADGVRLRQTSTTFTPTGKTATYTDPKGYVTQYAYDANDRLVLTTDPVGRQTRFAYDAVNRQISLSSLAIQSAPLVQQAYTPDGLLASLTNANGFATNFTPDGFDRLSTTTYPGGSTEVLAYDADGNITSRKTRADATITLTYDTLNRLATKAAPSEPTVTYTYDLANHPTGFSDNSASIAVLATTGTVGTLTSAYDSLNHLTATSWGPTVAQAAQTASSATFSYSYDRSNRRLSQTATNNSYWSYPAGTASTVSYTANNLDQYRTIGSVSPTYDGNGNLTFDGTFTYGYDAENRLISASGAGNTASYTYDARGRRKSKTVNGTTTILVQDPQGRALLDYAGTGGTIQSWYAFGSGLNDVLNQVNVAGSTRATYVPDIQGSIVASLDASSGTLTKAGYQSYGESTVTSGTFRYTGARIDAETNGLYDFRARVYSPTLGRFLQTDPVGTAGGINLYAYVKNDPLNLLDLLGFCPSCTGPDSPLEPGLGNGGEVTIFSVALSFFTFGASVGVEAAEGVAAGAGSAANVANGVRLAEQLTFEQAKGLFTATGELTPEAIANSRLIMQPSQLLNPGIPQGFAKYTTETLPNPFGGSFTTRFYMNPSTGEVFYGLDYKTLFLP